MDAESLSDEPLSRPPYEGPLQLRDRLDRIGTSRGGALALLDLASEFEDSVATIGAQFPGIPEPEDVSLLRDEIVQRQGSILQEIAGRFSGFLQEHWKEFGVLLFAVFSLTGYLYASQFYSEFNIPIGNYLQGIEDLALIGFLKGEWPLLIILLVAIWIAAIHNVAQWLGSRLAAGEDHPSATHAGATFLISALHPASMFAVVLVGLGLIFLRVPLSAISEAQANSSSLDARSSNPPPLHVRIGEDKVIQVERLLGTTSAYVFVLLPSQTGKDAVALSKSMVECIGPARTSRHPAIDHIYGIPPCDAVELNDPTLSRETRIRQGLKRDMARLLGCDVSGASPVYYEVGEFEFNDTRFTCPTTAATEAGAQQECTPEKVRSAVAAELRARLLAARDSQQGAAAFIVGFASHEGNVDYNLRLAERRAEAVRDLASEWPAPLRIYAAGEGLWGPALESKSGRTAMVVVCTPATPVDAIALASPTS